MNRFSLSYLLFIFLFSGVCVGQGRTIDAEIIILKPIAGETIISRMDGKYITEFMIKNNGPDSIKIGDKFFITITFGNVIYPSFFKYPTKIIAPESTDTFTHTLKMIWDTDVLETKFCGEVLLVNRTEDSVKKETKAMVANNSFCQIVAHDSRLISHQLINKRLKIYPNPCNDLLIVENDESNLLANSTIIIYDFTGKEIMNKTNPTITDNKLVMDLKLIPKGTFLVKVKNNIYTSNEILIIK